MPIARNASLSGSAPDSSKTALLILDMISDFEFEDGTRICRAALSVAKPISKLKQRATRAGVPVIYVNDNRGRWRSDFAAQVRQSMAESSRGAAIARLLAPGPVDYCILKPKHSAFYATVLGTLLEHLGVSRLNAHRERSKALRRPARAAATAFTPGTATLTPPCAFTACAASARDSTPTVVSIDSSRTGTGRRIGRWRCGFAGSQRLHGVLDVEGFARLKIKPLRERAVSGEVHLHFVLA